MKMRKKLAALLAAAMIASVMPMTAFAATANRVTKTVMVGKDKTIGTNFPELVIKNDKGDLANDAGKEFYLDLTDAEFATIGAIATTLGYADPGDDKEDHILDVNSGTWYTPTHDFVASPAPAARLIRVENKRQLAVKISQDVTTTNNEFAIPLIAKVTGANAKVTIDSNGTAVSDGSFVFATTNEAKSVVTIGDVPSFYTGTKNIAKITIDESYAGAFASATGDKENIIEITLDNDDFEVVMDSNNDVAVSPAYKKGFVGVSGAATFKVENSDKQKLVVTLNAAQFKNKQRGAIEITVPVKSTVKRPTVGDLKVEFSGHLVEEKEYKVATIAEYGVELKSEKAYEFVAGQEEKVEFHLNEIVDDSIVSNRTTDFTLPEGVYFKDASVKIVDGGTATITYNRNEDDDDKINGFSVTLPVNAKKVDKFKFEAKLEIESSFEGDVVLKAEGRSIGEELEATLATVKAPVTVKVEPMTVKVGLKEQKGGKITITEAEKGRLMQGKDIVISIDGEDGMTFTGDADVEVTSGDLRKGDVTVAKTKDGSIKITVKRKSKEASTIEISNISLKLDRTVPQGSYDVKVGGSAISKLADVPYKAAVGVVNTVGYKAAKTYGNDNIKTEEFIIVGTPNTEDIAGAANRAKVAFVVGSTQYLVNAQEATMDAAPYVKDGRTMVPVRYVAAALGVKADQVVWDGANQTATVLADKTIQVKLGSKMMVIDGVSVPMAAAAELKSDRTFVPVAEIARALGVPVVWDVATQTATFN